jgi:hypothetical protein
MRVEEALALRRCLRQGVMALTPPRPEPEPVEEPPTPDRFELIELD